MEKRLIVAIALSILIIVTFQYLTPKPTIPAVKGEAKTNAQEVLPVSPVGDQAISTPETAPAIEEKETAVEAGKYIATFSNIGGAIKSIQLKDYKDTKSGEPLAIVDLKDPRDYIFSLSGKAGATSLGQNPYEISKKDGVVTCVFKGRDVEITKRYIFHKFNYGMELELLVKNVSASPINLVYKINGGAGLHEKLAQDVRFVEVSTKADGKIIGFKRTKEGRTTIPGNAEWVALKNKYFSIILKPAASTGASFYGETKEGYFVSGVNIKDTTIPANYYVDNKFILYAGPSLATSLKELGLGLEETINYGFFGWIAFILMDVARILYKVTHNWGVAIILMSVLLNVVLFPLSLKSFKSMKKMHELHPHMEKLKTQFKDNPQKLNKEMLELYKKYNINPLSGCLPMLLQMPIFIALYQALSRSIELRCANFLWVKDLSTPDAVPIPITLPVIGNSVNILPLLMVA